MSWADKDPLPLPSWWMAKQESRTDPETALFSDENLFAPEDEAYVDTEAPPYVEETPGGWDYATAPAHVREVMDAISDAVDWLEETQSL